jgi:Tfp pilus assembly protein PilX
MIKNKILSIKNNARGTLLGATLIAMVVFTTLGAALMLYVTTQYTTTSRSVFTANALLVAEAGVEESVSQLNQDDGFVGHGEAQTFFDNEQQGRGEFETTVEEMADTNARTITSTGRVYRFGTDQLVNTRKVKVTVVGTGSEGYSVHTGPAGSFLEEREYYKLRCICEW